MFSRSRSKESAPSVNTDLATTTTSPSTQDAHPPSYTSLIASMQSLALGDPQERINVPMIHSHSSRGKTVQTVIIRKMTREHYLRKYAHDADGQYTGTEAAAPDAGLVFVPSKASSAELLAQVRNVAFAREHEQSAFTINGSTAMGFGTGC